MNYANFDYLFVGSIVLAVLGLLFGSFVGASVWRLRARQLRVDEAMGDDVEAKSKKEVSKLKNAKVLTDRSVCMHCGHKLSWYDLVPVVSWLSLKGRCRYCHKAIGWFEPFIELGMAAVFVVSYLFWPVPLDSTIAVTELIVWLIACVGLAILFVYDMRWFLLPDAVVFPLLGLGVINAIIVSWGNNFAVSGMMSIVYGCVILGGLYYLIYILSRYKWVGFGDVKLGLVLALLLADWQLSALTLFLANLIGTIMFLPFLISGRIKRQARIPFGPLLIAGWFIAGIFGVNMISWYLRATLGVL